MFSNGQAAWAKTITYGKLAKLMGYNSALTGHTLGRPLELIVRLRLSSGLPPFNVIGVSKEIGLTGAAVLLRPGFKVVANQEAVAAVDWFSWRAPRANAFRMVWEARCIWMQRLAEAG